MRHIITHGGVLDELLISYVQNIGRHHRLQTHVKIDGISVFKNTVFHNHARDSDGALWHKVKGETGGRTCPARVINSRQEVEAYVTSIDCSHC
ncbi:hypothetical protein PILCRDRAFT_524953 [Piloderma croceum F 1598]|uniref:Uncharacterized protein n=1 Tax=Piloderma croceum (strain F 1598) TaxID=765440 RepID=A0A0C3B3Z1_PILCF|nr:hypothetical protein PILCRDRAFT_524953 [Piloderma croceum F 1598]